MKKLIRSKLCSGAVFLSCLAIVFSCVSSSPPAIAQEKYSSEKLVNMYKDFLVSEGYRPELKETKNEGKLVAFKHEGGIYVISIHSNDPEYFHLVYLASLEVKSNEKTRVLEAINSANAEIKSVKIILLDDRICAAIQVVTPRVGDFKFVFKRSLNQIELGMNIFREKMSLRSF